MLKLNGKPLNLHPPCPAIGKIRAVLDKSGADNVYDGDGIAKLAGVAPTYIRSMGKRSDLDDYSYRVGKTRYWGSPRAIKELRRQAGEA